MKLQQFPQLDRRPALNNADQGLAFSKARRTEDRVQAYFGCAQELLALDNTKQDYNPHEGGVVVVDAYLNSREVESASLAYNRETGQVESFKLIEDDLNSVSFEYRQYDEHRSSNPTFTATVDGVVDSFEMNPSTGRIVG